MATTGMYCRTCSYDLRGQGEGSPARCSECGREFLPGDRRTYLARPRRWFFARWLWRLVVVVAMTGLVLGTTWGWLYWGLKREQHAMAELEALHPDPGHLGPYVAFTQEPLIGKRFQLYLGSTGWVLDRVRAVSIDRVSDADSVYLKDFHSLRELEIHGAGPDEPRFTDAGMANLESLKQLESLGLSYTDITDKSLGCLGNFKKLKHLYLNGTSVSDAGMANVREVKGLEGLCLDYSEGVTDAGLKHLSEMDSLQELELTATRVTDHGLAYVKSMKGLRRVSLWGPQVTEAGVKDLRAAKPGLQIEWGP